MSLPIDFIDVLEARRRIRPHLAPTPLRRYAELEKAVGRDLSTFVKHENHNPTNSFKVRNALSAMTLLPKDAQRSGVVAATRGNHGQGLAWAGSRLGISVVVCVPTDNNPEKNAAMRGFGAEVIEEGRDYDEAVAVAARLSRERGLTIVHSTNDRGVISGAATLTLEMLEEQPDLDAIVYAVGGGSQIVGGMVVARAIRPNLPVFGVQAEGASSLYESWKAKRPVTTGKAATIADGIATRSVYEMTFPALLEGVSVFVTVSEREIAEAIRTLLSTTHNLAEGAGAAGLAGLRKLAPELAGIRVGIVISGGNLDSKLLARIMNGWPDRG
jgi:threonine dehydratase